MNLVITGGFGFIGSYFLKSLKKRGIGKVKIITRNSDAQELEQIARLPFKTEIIQVDLLETNFEFLEPEDHLVHLAWGSNPSSTGNSIEVERALNVNPTKKLIQNAKETGIKKIVFLSSGGTVYGNIDRDLIEEDHPKKPISAYGKAKLEVEEMIISSGLEYVILRPSNAYGKGVDLKKGQGVIGHWIDKIKAGKSIQMVGDGTQIRDFIHVSDVAEAICESLLLKNITMNVGSEIGTSLNDLIDRLDVLFDTKTVIETSDFREFDVRQNVLSTRLIRSLTNWKPVILLDDGLESLIN